MKKRDKIILKEHMNSVISNMLRIIPERFKNLIEFNNWKTGERDNKNNKVKKVA